MRIPPEKQAVRQVLARLAELLGASPADVRVHPEAHAAGPDAVVDIGTFTFVVEWKNSGATAPVAAAVENARRHASSLGGHAIALVAVPFMGAVGRARCAEADVAWIDLSGNAHLARPGIRIVVDGQANQFKRVGRPSSAFAPKSSRIARHLLMDPNRSFTQRELARSTKMDEGFTSRIVAKLEADGLLLREASGAVRPRSPDLLLDAWREDYDFAKHLVLRGHVAARAGDILSREIAAKLAEHGDTFATTGLAAAWLMTGFAGFRIVSVYLEDPPSPELLERMGFRQDDRGANVWLVVPDDEGVFDGATDHGGVRCVHPIQVYLDLKGHPERADEAAAHLRTQLLDWRADG